MMILKMNWKKNELENQNKINNYYIGLYNLIVYQFEYCNHMVIK